MIAERTDDRDRELLIAAYDRQRKEAAHELRLARRLLARAPGWSPQPLCTAPAGILRSRSDTLVSHIDRAVIANGVGAVVGWGFSGTVRDCRRISWTLAISSDLGVLLAPGRLELRWDVAAAHPPERTECPYREFSGFRFIFDARELRGHSLVCQVLLRSDALVLHGQPFCPRVETGGRSA